LGKPWEYDPMAYDFDVSARNTVLKQAVGFGFVGALPGAIWIFMGGSAQSDVMLAMPIVTTVAGAAAFAICGAVAGSTAMLLPVFRKRPRSSSNEGRSEFVAVPIQGSGITKAPVTATGNATNEASAVAS
jgi:hypothetical protein